jgi:hypothetical protein
MVAGDDATFNSTHDTARVRRQTIYIIRPARRIGRARHVNTRSLRHMSRVRRAALRARRRRLRKLRRQPRLRLPAHDPTALATVDNDDDPLRGGGGSGGAATTRRRREERHTLATVAAAVTSLARQVEALQASTPTRRTRARSRRTRSPCQPAQRHPQPAQPPAPNDASLWKQLTSLLQRPTSLPTPPSDQQIRDTLATLLRQTPTRQDTPLTDAAATRPQKSASARAQEHSSTSTTAATKAEVGMPPPAQPTYNWDHFERKFGFDKVPPRRRWGPGRNTGDAAPDHSQPGDDRPRLYTPAWTAPVVQARHLATHTPLVVVCHSPEDVEQAQQWFAALGGGIATLVHLGAPGAKDKVMVQTPLGPQAMLATFTDVGNDPPRPRERPAVLKDDTPVPQPTAKDGNIGLLRLTIAQEFCQPVLFQQCTRYPLASPPFCWVPSQHAKFSER